MARTRAVIVGMIIAVGTGAAALPASATAAEPGFLQASDLPAAYEPADAPTAGTVVNQFALDADACTQTFERDDTATEILSLPINDSSTGTTALSEAVVVYPDAKTAKAAFRHHAATARAGAKCGSVDNVATNGVPASTVVYQKVKVPKIGQGSYGVGRGTGKPDETAIGIEFVSGPYVVVLNTFGNGAGPTVKQLAKIARKAEQRVSEG